VYESAWAKEWTGSPTCDSILPVEPSHSRSRLAMSQQFDICKMESDGSLRLIEAASDVERARARVKKLAAFSPGEYIIANRQTGERISIKSMVKQIVFQIGYDEKDLNARAELFRRCGHQVMSVADNAAAKQALTSIQNVDVFVVGHTAPEETRKEMVDWLKANFPKVKVVALIPSASCQLASADFNIVLNDWDEWLSLLAAATS
jgi:CheY-like chemotaxis protein